MDNIVAGLFWGAAGLWLRVGRWMRAGGRFAGRVILRRFGPWNIVAYPHTVTTRHSPPALIVQTLLCSYASLFIIDRWPWTTLNFFSPVLWKDLLGQWQTFGVDVWTIFSLVLCDNIGFIIIISYISSVCYTLTYYNSNYLEDKK